LQQWLRTKAQQQLQSRSPRLKALLFIKSPCVAASGAWMHCSPRWPLFQVFANIHPAACRTASVTQQEQLYLQCLMSKTIMN
jgi:hypothetical protein